MEDVKRVPLHERGKKCIFLLTRLTLRPRFEDQSGMAHCSISSILSGIAVALLGLVSQVEGQCIFQETQCQCAEIRSPGSECLRLEEGLGSTNSCISVPCNDGMQCSCSGFELCTVLSCAPVLVAASGDPTPVGATVECVSSTNTIETGTGATTERVCAKEIESDFSATIKTVAAASSASTTAAALSTEANEIAVYAAATEILLKQYSDEANSLILTTTSDPANEFALSPTDIENANNQLQDLVAAVDAEAAAAVSDKTKAEADAVAVAASAADSERWNQQTIASNESIERLNTQIPILEAQLEAVEDPFGMEAFVIAEQARELIDIRDNEVFFLQDHAHEAGLHARQARSTVRESRVLYSANIERRSNGELKLQRCRDFVVSFP